MATTTITLKDIRHIARLANLNLSTEQEKKFLKQIDSVIGHIDKLCEVDTSNTEPTSQTTDLEDVFRADIVDGLSMLSSDQATSGARKIHNDFFVVDMILSKNN